MSPVGKDERSLSAFSFSCKGSVYSNPRKRKTHLQNKCVEILAAANLELNVQLVLLDDDVLGVLTTSREKELLHVRDFTWHLDNGCTCKKEIQLIRSKLHILKNTTIAGGVVKYKAWIPM